MRLLRTPSERAITANCKIARDFALSVVEGTRRRVEQEGAGLGPVKAPSSPRQILPSCTCSSFSMVLRHSNVAC